MTEPLWTGEAILAATGGRPIGNMPESITGVSIDTRTVKPGEAFFAIKGERFDGHDFLSAAVASGASLLVVSEKRLPALARFSIPLLVVDDVLKAMERLAVVARMRTRANVIAITGSVGKTTTKEALRHALAACGTVHASAASFNNHWGVPLSLARLPEDTDFAIFEIGMNHPGEIRPLVKLVQPHVAIVTLIAPAHLGHFRDLQEIAEAKGEIFEGLAAGGAAIVNADDPFGPHLANMARAAGAMRITSFGEAATAEYRLMRYQKLDGGSSMEARIDGVNVDVRLASAGRHLAQNVLAVLGAVDLVGGDLARAAAALAGWRAGKGRGARHDAALPDGGSFQVIDESYNANPASMRASIAVLASTEPGPGGRRVAVMGDMLELGEHADQLHGELAQPLAEAAVDAVFLVGPAIRVLADALQGQIACQWFGSVQELQARLKEYLKAGDVVMLKASNGIGLARVVEGLVVANGHADEVATPETSAQPAG
ncbi:UDP-N-acetylmuramoylalanyl-D-glutamyl-2,6-diaminopimelate--D-alanyl-D-alanine ligase [Aureimonas fodinaquatilis]|uniref:UDP-N-acetylmuramoyl-tripeptide--D-alanyl-D-alanine ligase n=1 Tax=Aureimonas fodinaquatilis TaxID=2565783 RepID=A0A5B0E567_9HYPH|nr:UDP-N-acetylmuramoylalanyl-D-glutamyl-2,6-diaminopimelate--D-alanyl-D-alanine ligase [Aureimonas fodinaquatilis]KAA0972579.1 UDP-N-acetylmuramoylalanyl-D-glutamyl-2,6-diaminopimelate--D-alanyl-D-alanine ligase [Aureimonas fodinaquatilis]